MNSDSIFLKPTFYALSITGIAILVIIILVALNHKKIIKSHITSLILMIAIVANLIANHGNLHHILERDFGYNPLKSTYIYFNSNV